VGTDVWAVILDMDGVIVDSEAMHVAIDAQVCAEYGVLVDEKEFERYIGTPAPDTWRDARERYGLQAPVEDLIGRARELYEQALADGRFPDAVPGIVDLVRALHGAGVPVAVASSTVADVVRRILERLDILKLIDAIVGGDQVRHGKPHPEIYSRAAALIGMRPDRCVAIEDSAPGVRSARSAGMACVGYRNVGSGGQDLSSASVIVDTIPDLSVEALCALAQQGDALEGRSQQSTN
jgi:HAD superfamily hydrolase (TIGR01509 family)